MNSLTQFKKISILAFLIALMLVALAQNTQAVSPPPDGGYPSENTAEGDSALFHLTTGQGNTADGFQALFSNTTGQDNIAIGDSALFSNTTGGGNVSTGDSALGHNTTGNQNTATGILALLNNSTGNHNIAVGASAGSHLTTGSNNIDIGANVLGVAGEANTIRIGKSGVQTKTVVAGIHGVGVTGIAVVVGSTGQLGVAPSSQRFKAEIKPMGKASEGILALKPVTFRYKKDIDPDSIPQFGLVAEEVEKVNPALVTRDSNGESYTVRYEAVNAMLLNEFLKEHGTVQEQQATIAQLKKDFAEQQKQIEALTTGLQKVSAQFAVASPSRGGLELSKFATGRVRRGGPAPQMVVENR